MFTRSALLLLVSELRSFGSIPALALGLRVTSPLYWNLRLLIFIRSFSRLKNLRFDEVMVAGSGITLPVRDVLL